MSTVHLPHLFPGEDWMRKGKCRGLDHKIFYPPAGHHLLTRQAIEICNSCPVQMDCLDYALRNFIDHGIWGGTSERERRRIRTARRKSSLRLAPPPLSPPESAYG